MKTPDRYQQAEEMFNAALAFAPERRAEEELPMEASGTFGKF